jgi:hypothetical protein
MGGDGLINLFNPLICPLKKSKTMYITDSYEIESFYQNMTEDYDSAEAEAQNEEDHKEDREPEFEHEN